MKTASKLSTVHNVDAKPRAAAVAKFRELADKLESGELLGARVQWREGLNTIEVVELDEMSARLRTINAEGVF